MQHLRAPYDWVSGNRQRVVVILSTILMAFFSFVASAKLLDRESTEGAAVSDMRVWYSPDKLRMVMELNSPLMPNYKVFVLDNPNRLVVDFYSHVITTTPPTIKADNAFVSRFRLGQPNQGVSRLVMDLKQPVRIQHSFVEASGFKPRVVLDVHPGVRQVMPSLPSPSVEMGQNTKQKAPTIRPESRPQTVKQPAAPSKDLIVVIDAGHGGKDPGALGRRTKEKNVVLEIAQRVKRKIDATPGMRAVLTRSNDVFIKLNKRREIARQRKADLFVSIHADAFRKKSARGSSVYALSLQGASSEEAKWLAQKENAADLVGGVALSKYDEDVREVLLDLSMGDTIHQSIVFANSVLDELKKVGKVHSRKVERAGFLVLKSPDIPSILVETAFITNPQEEKLLRTRAYQDKLATAVLNGIKAYQKQSGR